MVNGGMLHIGQEYKTDLKAVIRVGWWRKRAIYGTATIRINSVTPTNDGQYLVGVTVAHKIESE